MIQKNTTDSLNKYVNLVVYLLTNLLTMKKILTQLIHDDIKATRLVRALGRVEVDASHYLTNKSTVIFELLNVKSSPKKDALLDAYFVKIEQASDGEKQADGERIDEIIEWLEAVAKDGSPA
jgi:hypothetical protein